MIGRSVPVVRPLHVKVRAQKFNGLDGHRPFIYGNVIHAIQSRNGLGPQVLAKDRAVRPLIHVAIRRDGDNEDVPHLFSLLEIANVPYVQKIKNAVAVDNSFARAKRLKHFGQLFKTMYFIILTHP